MRRRVVAISAAGALALAASAFANSHGRRASVQDVDNGTAALVHEGPNPATCGQTPGTDSGVVNVHSNVVQNRRRVNISVHNALPNTTYEVDIRCVSAIGFLTTNRRGTGTAHIDLAGFAWPTPVFYIDLLTADPNGAVGFGDVFTAGPFLAT